MGNEALLPIVELLNSRLDSLDTHISRIETKLDAHILLEDNNNNTNKTNLLTQLKDNWKIILILLLVGRLSVGWNSEIKKVEETIKSKVTIDSTRPNPTNQINNKLLKSISLANNDYFLPSSTITR